MRQRSVTPSTDYSGYFLVAILLGIVLVVLAVTMAVAQSGPRSPRVVERPAVVASATAAIKAAQLSATGRFISRQMELLRDS